MSQYYRSDSLEGLEYKEKYGLSDYADSQKPLVVFGMYRDSDFELVKSHKGDLTIVWQGSDARNLPKEWAEVIRDRNCRNIAISHWIFDALMNNYIYPELKGLSATIDQPELANCPNGDFVHFYTSVNGAENAKYLGAEMIPSLIEKTGIPIIQTAFGLFNKPDLFEIYKKCFLNLRLTHFDGCPNSALEMGLMGRRSVFNGKGFPGAIPWIDVNHVADIILHEYENRKNPNIEISNQTRNFIAQNTL